MSWRQRREWRQLFCEADGPTLAERALAGQLRNSSVRSLAWRFFLGTLPPPLSAWPSHAEAAAARYEQLRKEHCRDPSEAADDPEIDLAIAHPLSQHSASPWQSFFEASELRSDIEKDLERLHPGDAFFAQPAVREQMLRILFIWSRINASVSYRQGMHELLAPFVWLITVDAEEAASEATKAAPGEGTVGEAAEDEPVLRALLKKEDVEAASYQAFSALMSSMACWFAPAASAGPGAAQDQVSPLLKHCVYIQDKLLRRADPQLQRRLTELEVEPQLYLLRWLRLLFGREFHLVDSCVVWDAIFAFGAPSLAPGGPATPSGAPLELVDFIAVVMLMYVRGDLLSRDYNHVLRRLLKFPPIEDVTFLVERATQPARAPASSQVARHPEPKGRAPSASGPLTGGAVGYAKSAVAKVAGMVERQPEPKEAGGQYPKATTSAIAAAALAGKMEVPLQILERRVPGALAIAAPNAPSACTEPLGAQCCDGGKETTVEGTDEEVLRALAELRVIQQVLAEAGGKQ